MEIFTNVVFYLLVLIVITSIIVILISKQTKVYLWSTITTFSAIAGLYIILKSPVMFVVQIIFFVLGTGLILFLGASDFKAEDKFSLNLSTKTFLTLLFLGTFVLLGAPFLIQQIKAQIISGFCIEHFFPSINSFVNLVLILFSILIIALLSGFYTIAFWRKK